MRIGVDIRNLLKPFYSGVSEYTFQILDAMIKQAPADEFKLWYNSYQRLDRHLPDFLDSNVKKVPTKIPNKLLNASLLLAGRPHLDTLVGGCDIFWSPDINFSAFSSSAKNIITVHDLSPIRFPEFFNAKHNLWYKLIRPAQKIKTAHHLIAVSQSTKQDLINLFAIPAEKITVIYEGILPHFKPILQDSREATNLRDKYKLPPRFILFLATLEPRKNIPSIIKALELVPENIPLVIAGKKGWKYQEIFDLAAHSSRKIQFLNYVNAEEKPALYSLADIFIWPSHYEGFGLPPLEAQACGTPVIVGANSSLVEIIGGSGLLVNSDHPQEIALAISELWNNPELRQKYAQKGLVNAQRFSWEKAARETLELFRKLAS